MADPVFLKLQAEWDEKLKSSGFKDAEVRDGKGGSRLYRSCASAPLVDGTHEAGVLGDDTIHALPQTHPHESSAASKVATATYYRMVGAFLHEHAFTCEADREVWALHSEGTSLRQSANELGRSVKWVRIRVERLKQTMLRGRARPVTCRKQS